MRRKKCKIKRRKETLIRRISVKEGMPDITSTMSVGPPITVAARPNE
jgi:hypothetical protein